MLIAVYSRKSKWTGKGESVENQLIMCREYIAMFIEGGDQAQILEFEDEGFSGKDTRRPRFQQMMQELKTRHFDYLVCYRLDRLGRNLADLANLMEDLNRMNTSFISVREKFDTTTPIGKAMLYFSGVLAQMEREQIAERVKDNMIMLARSGRWLGGNTPLGFSSMKLEQEAAALKKKSLYCLTWNPGEIPLVRFIFSCFLERRSITKVLEALLADGIKTRRGREFTVSGIRDILVNPVYCVADQEAWQYFYDMGCQVCIDREELDQKSGLMAYARTTSSTYKNQSMPLETWIISMGRHQGVIRGEDYVRVQKLLEDNKSRGENFRNLRNNASLLSGLVCCTCDHRMRPKNYPASRVTQKGERTFSYRCPYKDKTHGERCGNKNVHGNRLDNEVCRRILRLAAPDEGMIPLLEELRSRIRDTNIGEVSRKALLSQEYEKKRGKIQALVASVGKLETQSVSVRYINEEIQRLDAECRELERRIGEEEEAAQRAEQPDFGGDFSEGLMDFPAVFDRLPFTEKREFLKEIIEEVLWDGESAHVYLRKGSAPPQKNLDFSD